MTREDLKGIVEGIGDEQLKRILDINTADIGKAKGDFAALQAENDTLKAAKQELEGKINELSEKSSTADDYKKQLEELKSEMREKEKAAKAEAEDKALTEAIEALFGDREPTSEYIRTGLIADMKKEIAKPENKGKGYGAIFESLTEGVDAATFGRVAGESPVREAVKRLVFELTELYAANGADGSAVLSSASNDGVSESYVVLSGEELIQREKALISQYLSGEITQEGIPLLYAGVD